MARLATMLLVLGLLGGTAAAFAVTETLKLERSPITRPRIAKVFSPVCRCESSGAGIQFTLRERDRLTVAIVDDGGEPVRTLARSSPEPRGEVRYTWDGRDDAGRVVPEGSYWPRVHLAEQRRTIRIPNPIRVDVTPPRIELVRVSTTTISPDGDGRSDRVKVRYRVSEPAHGLLFVRGRQKVRTRFQPLEGELSWYGKVGGRPVRPGSYRLVLGAEDTAGNRSTLESVVVLRIRYIELARDLIRAKARTRFGVRIDTDARAYRWRFAGRTGRSSARLLVLRAPKAGRYRLFVEVNGHADRARVIVVPRGR